MFYYIADVVGRLHRKGDWNDDLPTRGLCPKAVKTVLMERRQNNF